MLSLLNEKYLQALESIAINNNWITIVLLALFVFIFILKGLNSTKLKGYATALFNNVFIEKEIEDYSSFFKAFYALLFVFMIGTFSLLFLDFKVNYLRIGTINFTSYVTVNIGLACYFLIKWTLEYLLSLIFIIKKEVQFFLASKSSYLYSISFIIFGLFILINYTEIRAIYIYYITVFLFLIRFIIHVLSNKNLIFNKLFYFILYLCAFEIAPLFVLFKFMLK